MLKITPILKNLTPYIPFIVILSITGLTTSILRALPTKASVTTPVSVTVPSSCSFSADADTHSATITSGLLEELDGITLTSICNGAYDSQILAIGFTNDTAGNTTLSSATDTINTLDNCSALSPSSCWSMKVTGLDTDTYPFTPQNNYDTYKSIPEKETLIAKTELKTEANPKSTLKTTYNIYATTTQPAGTYTGKVKYTLTTEPSNLKIYIQDLTLDDCKVNVGANGNAANIGDNITVYDKRDENDYTVRYINGYCWMTQNLRFIGDAKTSTITLNSTTSNVNADKTFTYYDLAGTEGSSSSGHCYGHGNGSAASTGGGYTYACIHASDDATIGAWYNFGAASALYVSGLSNSSNTAYDLCPNGWHLPTGPATTSSTQFYRLFQSTSNSLAINSYLLAFGAVVGGEYVRGSIWDDSVSFYWSATASSSAVRHSLYYNGNKFRNGDNDHRYDGNFVRCVRTS